MLVLVRIRGIKTLAGEKAAFEHQLREQGMHGLRRCIDKREMAQWRQASYLKTQPGTRRGLLPSCLHPLPDAYEMRRYVTALVLPQRGQRRSRTDTLCPGCAADKSALRRLA